MAKVTYLVPDRVTEEYEKAHGYIWTIKSPEASYIEVWPDAMTEAILIRQDDSATTGQVDLISLNQGQAYDLIRTLARALEV